MATADKVTVELEAKRGKFDRDIEGARSKFQKEMGAISGSAAATEKRIRASSDQIGSSLRGIAAGLATGATIGALTKLADGYTTLQNRLRVVGLEGQALEGVQNRLYEAANRNGVAVGDLAQLYSRIALSAGELGASQSQLLSLTDGVTAALRVQGVSAEQASGPLLQLGQALGAGIVRAEEYNSIIEGVPILAQAAAKGLDATGGSVAKLRSLVIDGKVSSQQFFQALLKGLPDVEKQAQKSTLTIGQSLQTLNNELGRYVGQTDQSLSASQRLSAGIVLLSQNLDKIVPAITTLTLLVGARYVAAGTAAVASSIAQARASALAAQNAIAHARAVEIQAAANARLVATGGAATAALKFQAATTLSAAGATAAFGRGLLGLAGGPIGVAIIAVAALVAGINLLNQRFSEGAVTQRKLDEQTQRTSSAFREYEEAAEKAAKATGEAKKAADDLVLVKRAQYEITLANAQALAEETAQMAAQRAEMAKLAAQEALNGRPKEAGEALGQLAFAAGADSEARRAQAQADKAAEDYAKTLSDLFDLQQRIANGFAVSAPGATTDGKKPKGKSAEQLAREAEQRARLLADLEASTRLEEASLAQDVAKVRELERQAEITARIRQLKDAGLSADQAQAASSKVQSRLDEARVRDIERRAALSAAELRLTIANLNENYELVRQEELKVEYAALLEARKATTLSTEEAIKQANEDLLAIEEARIEAAQRALTTANKSHQARIAELTGNTKLLKQLNDQAEIERRIAEYRQNGRLSKEAATTQATAEVTAERAATTYGEQRDFFANTFSEGIRAAWAGDLQGFLASQFGNLADMALKKLGESLFDSVVQAPAAVAQAQAEGVTQGLAFSATVGPAITVAGTTAATAMGTAILAAGTQVAALIASANAVPSIPIPGFANGTRSAPGGMAVVGERGPELVNLPRGSQVIPNHQLRSVGRNQQHVVKLVVEESAYFAPRVSSIAGPIAVQASTTGVAYTQDAAQTASKRRGQSFIG